MVFAVSSASRAEPLSPEACAAIEAEHAALSAAGLPEVVKIGPAAGREAPASATAKEVARYIHVREQFLFRCGHDKKRAVPLAPDGEGAADAASAKPAPSAPALPKPKPAAGNPATAKVKAAKGPDAPAGSKPAVKPPPKSKPKVEDAFRPATKEPAKAP